VEIVGERPAEIVAELEAAATSGADAVAGAGPPGAELCDAAEGSVVLGEAAGAVVAVDA
jgi:hypothetical protein